MSELHRCKGVWGGVMLAVNKKRKEQIDALFDSMAKVKGEVRTVNECGDCKALFGRRFIPFSLGQGLTVIACLCQITAHRPSKTIAERKP